MFGASHRDTPEARTDLETHRRRERHHPLCQICLELVKDRFTKSNRNVAYNRLNYAPKRISIATCLINTFRHFRTHNRIRTAYRTRFYLLKRYRVCIHFSRQRMDLLDISKRFSSCSLTQDLFRNSPGCDAPNSFTCARSPTALPIPDAIFLLIRKIGM